VRRLHVPDRFLNGETALVQFMAMRLTIPLRRQPVSAEGRDLVEEDRRAYLRRLRPGAAGPHRGPKALDRFRQPTLLPPKACGLTTAPLKQWRPWLLAATARSRKAK